MDGTLRYAYHPKAVSDLHEHALLSSVNVVRAVIAVVVQPGAAKIADIFGRTEMYFISVVFYVVGIWTHFSLISGSSKVVRHYC